MSAQAYDDVVWGISECQRRPCSAAAELLYDGLPLCIACADRLLERQLAIAIEPRVRDLLPAWNED